MKGLNLLFFSFSIFYISCEDPCYQHFNAQELEFATYEKDRPITLMDTNNVVHPMKQTKYRRELFESCGSMGCSGDYTEVYEIEYRSTLNQDWGFNLNLYAPSCRGTSAYLGICSDDLSSYRPDRWIFGADPDSVEVKYDTIVVNSMAYYNVVELSGWGKDSKRLSMLFNEQMGIIQITFPTTKTITLVP